jgi:ABC-type tungstate transport system substrate-binding protein
MNTLTPTLSLVPNFTINKLFDIFKSTLSVAITMIVITAVLCLPLILFLATKAGA